MSNKKPQKLNNLLSKIDGVDDRINTLTKKIEDIKKLFEEQCRAPNEDEEEHCQDVIESEKAVIKAIEEMFIDELLTREPEGDA